LKLHVAQRFARAKNAETMSIATSQTSNRGSMNGKVFLIAAVIASTACARATPPRAPVAEPYTSGDHLIEAMQNRYVGRWYRTLTFVQETTQFPANAAERKSTWYEALQLPSLLRIDFDAPDSGNGVIVRRDTQFVMQRGAVVRRVPQTNELLLLGFDVYFLPPAQTSAWLRQLGFDLSRIRQDVWQGRQVYVVGARDSNDLKSRQFWIDREHLLFVRLLQPAGTTERTTDVRFLNYERIGRTWIAPLVEIYEDGRLVMKEEYRHMRVDVDFDPALFDPARFTTARHWYGQRR
jgi:outer membrane lipoprotein-sorting protein